jgi:hypothetical protein
VSLVRYWGGTEQLAWTCQWIVSGAVAFALVMIWRNRHIRYSLKPASLAVGAMLITPYLFMYDMMVLAIPSPISCTLDLGADSLLSNCRRSVSRSLWFFVLRSGVFRPDSP